MKRKVNKVRANCLKCNGEGMVNMPINSFGNVHPDFCPDCNGSGKSNVWIEVKDKERR